MGDVEQAPPPGTGTSALKVALAFASVYLFWGSTYLAIRVAVETMPPLIMAGARFLLAGGLLYAWARGGQPRPEPVQWRSAFIVGGLLLLGGNGGVVWAERTVPSGMAALMVSSVPLWIALFQWQRVTLPTGLGLLGGFAGVAWLVPAGKIDPRGAALLGMACVSWALGSLVARTAPFPPSKLLGTSMQMLAGGALQVVAGLAIGEAKEVVAPSAASWASWGYLVVFGSLFGFVPYIWLLGVRPAAQVATYAYVNPVVAVILGWLILDEPLTGRTLGAAALIVASVAAITVSAGRSAPAGPGTRR
jgi:drug/metabolite transporter (DMT)-like permease